MPGTPPTSPRFGAPRIANGDDFDLATDLNAVTDTFDAEAVHIDDLRPESSLAAGATGLLRGSFSAYRNIALSLANGAAVVFDAEEYDTSSWFSTSTGRFTPQVAGVYRFNWLVALSGGAAIDVFLRASLRKNGGVAKFGQTGFQRGALAVLNSGATADAAANGTTDFFDVMVEHSAGVALQLATASTGVGSAGVYFQGELVGRT